MGELSNKVAIVTGAGRGLGRSHALELARQGARVVVNDLGVSTFTSEGRGDVGPAEEVVEAIRTMGGQAIADASDISDWNGARNLIERAVGEFGQLDIVVNNAAISRFAGILEVSEADWRQSIDVNLTGTAAMCHWAADHWSKSGPAAGRRIVNTSSGVGLAPVKGNPMYVAAKAGVAALTVACAIELAELGVMANAIAPVARTRISEFVAGDAVKAPAAGFDKLDPDNVAVLVGYLASDRCRFTGRVLGMVGDIVTLYEGWSVAAKFDNGENRWELSELAQALAATPVQADVQLQSIGGVFSAKAPADDVIEALAKLA